MAIQEGQAASASYTRALATATVSPMRVQIAIAPDSRPTVVDEAASAGLSAQASPQGYVYVPALIDGIYDD